MKTLSIVVPVYNEEKTLEMIINRVEKVKIPKIKTEIVIVNDSSTDKSSEVISKLQKKFSNIRSFSHKFNQGKGASIRDGFKLAKGNFIVIQDGDLEYNPEDFKKLVLPLLNGEAKVVYGSRLLGHTTGFNIASHYYGNRFLSFVTKILYQRTITDMETCYKMMTSEVVRSLNLKSNRFDIEPEITAKIIKKGYKILELPVDYNCRSFKEGKKITWRDGIVAVYTLLKYRFLD